MGIGIGIGISKKNGIGTSLIILNDLYDYMVTIHILEADACSLHLIFSLVLQALLSPLTAVAPLLQSLKQLQRAAQSSGTEDAESLQLAIEVVAEADDDALTRQLIDFLMGEVDGIPKVSPKLRVMIRDSLEFSVENTQVIFKPIFLYKK